MTSTRPHTYGQDFYRAQASGSIASARVVLPLVFDVVQPKSVVDVGCGVGTWLFVARELGAEQIVGFDGIGAVEAGLVIDVAHVVTIDLNTEMPRDKARFDLAICLEVAEHLDPTRSDELVEALCALSDSVLFSAAIPGQIGTGHINLQRQSQWASRFEQRGYNSLDIVRPVIWNDERVDYWYRQNAMVYSRSDQVNAFDQRPDSARTPHDLVHPELNEYWVRQARRAIPVGEAASLFATAARRAARRRWEEIRHGDR